MWPSAKLTADMCSSSLPARPWTPPDTDSDCFPDIHTRSASPCPSADGASRLHHLEPTEGARPKLPCNVSEPAFTNAMPSPFDNERPPDNFSGADAHTRSRTPGVRDAPAQNRHTGSYVAEPLTPIKTPSTSVFLPGMPPLPYTPESMRTAKSHRVTVQPPSPSPSMPRDPDLRESRPSPVQHALSSCVSNLEKLIHTREPNDEQLEYLVSKFEEMARFLSAPEAQSRQTEEHLFSELEKLSNGTASSRASDLGTNDHLDADDLALSRGYVLEVSKYIEHVKRHVKDLTMRMDEVKTLNSIQLDIINDLRCELRTRKNDPKQEKEKHGITKIPPQRQGFWFAIGESLDFLGEMLHEW